MIKQHARVSDFFSSKLLTCMSRPGTEWLLLPIEVPGPASGPSCRSSVDTYSYKKKNADKVWYTNFHLILEEEEQYCTW